MLFSLAKFKDVKFLKIRATQAVENWPEKNCPTLFVYHEGVLQHQFMTLKSLGGTSLTADGKFARRTAEMFPFYVAC